MALNHHTMKEEQTLGKNRVYHQNLPSVPSDVALAHRVANASPQINPGNATPGQSE